MRITPTDQGTFVIERGLNNVTYFTGYADGWPTWSRFSLHPFKTEKSAKEQIEIIKERNRLRRKGSK